VNVAARLPTSGSGEPPENVPEVASARGYLRSNMPAVYREDPDGFGMRFLGALERVLDPQVAILDCLAAYLEPQLAPPAMVIEMGDWLGLPHLDEGATERLLGVSARLAQRRGTRAGLEIALGCCFPDLSFTVEDHGRVITPSSDNSPPAYPGFTVSCQQSLSPADRASVQQMIEWQRPLQVDYQLIDGTGTK
jgi:phage tail-like protein